MAERRLIHSTTSLCSECRNGLPAKVIALDNNEVWMFKSCPEHGEQSVFLSNNAEWYENTRNHTKPKLSKPNAKQPIKHGCPFDCGPCQSHEQKIKLPVVTINSSCNLDCPICYVHNKNKDAFIMSFDEFKTCIAELKKTDQGQDILNMTGGDPTLHPQFVEFLEYAKNQGIHRITLCTNGIKFVKDPSLLERIAQIGARVALSFDSFEEKADYLLQGAKLLKLKLECLDLLEHHNINTTLIPVMTKGVNDHEIGAMIELLFQRRNIRHLEVHTITYTGQSGRSFDRSGRITMFEVLQQIEKTTNGYLTPEDFISSPCAHPLCYQIAYFLMDPSGNKPIPFTRFLSRDDIYSALSEHLYLEPNPEFERSLNNALNDLWITETEEGERVRTLLKMFIQELFPTDKLISEQDRLRIGEKWVKAVYIHSHMDEETFDVERAVQCCDSNIYADGSSIPVCNYNVLYRDKDPRFNTKPVEWNERSGGAKEIGHE